MKKNIPLFDLNYDRKEELALLKTLRSKWISTGPKTVEFEREFSKMLEAEHSLALANCTVALHLAMRVLGIRPGDEVICPSLTFVATVNAIRYVDALPIFADIIGHDDLTIDPDEIEKRITKKTRAIVVMHYGGFACKMGPIMKIARKHNVKIIEDACHAPLAEYEGRKLGSLGDIGCFSFFSNKNISTGEGGMFVCHDSALFEKAKLLRSHGMTSLSYDRFKGHSSRYDVVELGYNYRMDDIRATLGIVQLKKLKSDLEKRSIIRSRYIERLSANESIVIPFRKRNDFSANHIFAIVLKDSSPEKRDDLRRKLESAGIQTSIHYPPVHRYSIYKKYYVDLPRTDYVSGNEISLPMYGALKKIQVDHVCNMINDCLH